MEFSSWRPSLWLHFGAFMVPARGAANARAREQNAARYDRRTSVEDEVVGGTHATFEELLARELQKADANASANASRPQTSNRRLVAKRPFLRRGDRGWWMQRSDIVAKLPKHVLTSKDMNDQPVRRSAPAALQPAAKPRTRSPPPQQQQRRSQPLMRSTPPPPPQSPPPPPQPAQPSWQEESSWRRIEEPVDDPRASTDTLDMSRIRQSYEEKVKREADELATFEAIEQELAAERDAYLMDKHQQHPHEEEQARCDDEDDIRSLYSNTNESRREDRYSSASSMLAIDRFQQQQQRPLSPLSYQNGGASARLSLDERHDDLYPQHDVNQLRAHMGRGSAAFSDLSAISFNDSEPWGDPITYQLQPQHANGISSQPLSPIPQHGMASSLLHAGSEMRDGYNTFDRSQQEYLWTGKGIDRSFEDIDHYSELRESHALQRDDERIATEQRGFARLNRERESAFHEEDAPVSYLVRQVFGQYGEDYDDSHLAGGAADTTDDEEAETPEKPSRATRQQNNPSGAVRARSSPQSTPSVRTVTATAKERPPTAATKRVPARKPPLRGGKTATSGGQAKAAIASRQPSPSPKRSRPLLPVVIEEKLFELEEEVKFYKAETLQLQKKKEHCDQELKKIANEREAFAKWQNDQKQLMDKEWEKQRAKMRQEQKLQERQWKLRMNATGSQQDRKGRQEIEILKAQIVKMQLDEKTRAAKWKAGNDSLRQRITELENKNRELSDEIKFLEADRLEQWDKFEALRKENEALDQQTSNNGSSRHSGAEMKTMNDLLAIKDTADTLLNGWRMPASARSTTPVETSSAGDASLLRSSGNNGYNPYKYQPEEDLTGPFASGDQALGSDSSPTRRNEFMTRPETDWSRPNGIAGDAVVSETVASQSADPPKEHIPSSAASGTSSTDNKAVMKEILHPGGKKEILYRDGSRTMLFMDGNIKEIDADGHTVIRFTNGDRKELFPATGMSIYYYNEAQTKLTTYADQTKVYEFPNDQVEKSYPDGTTEIFFADGIKKTIHANGDEISVFPDGTTMLERPDGLREVTLLNQTQIRYYPDGHMGWVAPNGQETQVRSDAELKRLMEDP